MMSKISRIVVSVVAFCLSAAPVLGQPNPLSSQAVAPQGVLSPWKICRAACAESGLVEQILVKPGDTVSKGQVLARLETNQQRLTIAYAQAQAQAVGRVQSAKADVELHSRRLKSVENARPNGYTSQSELERAKVELEMAQGRLATEQEELAAHKLHVDRLEYQLEQRWVVAPFSGTVVQVLKEIGEYVAPNTPEVIELVDPSRLRAVFYLNLKEVGALANNSHPTVEIDGQRFTDTELEFVAPVADPESGLVEVRVIVLNPSKRVMGASCSLVLTGTEGQST